jgi:hypothetical protein
MSEQQPVLAEIVEERARQDAKWGQQDHSDLSPAIRLNTDGVSRFWLEVLAYYRLPSAGEVKQQVDRDATDGVSSWVGIALEELVEAVEAAAAGDEDQVRAEVVQLTAVGVQWLQAIDRRRAAREAPS